MHSYDLQGYTIDEKRNVLASLMPWQEKITPLETRLQNVVYLKNGSRIKGVIVELLPDSIVKIQTADSSLFVFKMDEVEKVTKDESQTPVMSNIVAFDSIVSKNSKPKSFASKGTTELGGNFSYQSVTPISNGSSGNAINIFQLAPFIGGFVADGFELGVNPFGITSVSSGGGSATELLVLGSVSYNVRTKSKVFPFVEGLLGYSSVSASGVNSASGLSWGIRGGIKHSITDNGLFNLSLEYIQITTEKQGATNRTGTDQFLIQIGFTVWF